jgi:hypothetical protein
MKQFNNLAIKQGFTLMELLIIVALITLISLISLILLNPKKQLEKAWDGQRKHELATLQKTFEDFYNDKNCYPRPDEVCYEDKTETTCPICGHKAGSLSPYLGRLSCDPQSPAKEYLYHVDNLDCPKWYKVYAVLAELPQDESYNYGVSSGNTNLGPYPPITPPPGQPTPTPTIGGPTPTPPSCPLDPVPKYCFKDEVCNNCGNFANCQAPGSCNQPLQLYQDYQCSITCY